MTEQKKALNRLLYKLSCYFLVVLGLFCSNALHADSLIVLSHAKQPYNQAAQIIERSTNEDVDLISLEQLAAQPNLVERYDLVITLGSRAADYLLTRVTKNQRLILSFLPRQTALSLLDQHKQQNRLKEGLISAVYVDQPYERQLALARLIAPQAKKIATALGSNSKNDLPLIERSAKKQQLQLLSKVLTEDDNPIQLLQPLVRKADIFLALPDRSVFTRTTAKWILYISFRQRIPLIGFSKKYVDAGAIAAVYSSPEDIGKQTAEMLVKSHSTSTLPSPEAPRYFSVATNPTAAKSLRIRLPKPDELEQRLKEITQ